MSKLEIEILPIVVIVELSVINLVLPGLLQAPAPA